MCGAKRLKLDLYFAKVGHGRISSIEGPIGCSRKCPSSRTSSDDDSRRNPSARRLAKQSV
jgi:hypothetical protein